MKFVSCMFFLVVAVAQAEFGCLLGDSRTDQEVNGLINAIKKTPFTSDKIEILLDSLRMSDRGFTGNQTVAVFESLGFAAWSGDSVDAFLPFIMNLECQDLSRLIGTVPFPKDKLLLLTKYVPLVVDLNPNNATLIEAFTTDDKAKAQKIIDEAKGAGGTCLFGYGLVEAKRVTLVVDVSRYMGLVHGNSRVLQYLKDQLNLAIDSMTDDQLFNVVYYWGDRVSRQWTGLVPRNAANVQAAHSTINKLRYNEYFSEPDLKLALQAADAPNNYAIFVLSAGIHSRKEQEIIDFVSAYSSTTDSNGIPRSIYTSAFNAKATSANFMSEVAKAGHGTFRNVTF